MTEHEETPEERAARRARIEAQIAAISAPSIPDPWTEETE